MLGIGEILLIVLGVLVLVVFLILAGIVVFFLLARSAVPEAPRTPPRVDEDVREIARRRYATGEITREEYQTLRQDLED